MNYEIDWQATYNAIMDLPPNVFFSCIIFEELAEEAGKHDIIELFDDDMMFSFTDDGTLEII